MMQKSASAKLSPLCIHPLSSPCFMNECSSCTLTGEILIIHRPRTVAKSTIFRLCDHSDVQAQLKMIVMLPLPLRHPAQACHPVLS